MPVVGTSNVRNNPDLPREAVVKCGKVAAEHCDIVGFQEIREDEDFIDIAQGLGDSFAFSNTNTSVPIAFRRAKFELANPHLLPNGFGSFGSILLHDKVAGYTPPRWLSWTILDLREGNWTSPVAFMNTHFINKAWNGEEEDPAIEEERQALWWDSWEAMQQQTLKFRRVGLPVVFVGDFNKASVQEFNRHQVWAVNGGIDKIGVIPPRGYQATEVFDINEVERWTNPSDHDLRTADIHIIRY